MTAIALRRAILGRIASAESVSAESSPRPPSPVSEIWVWSRLGARAEWRIHLSRSWRHSWTSSGLPHAGNASAMVVYILAAVSM
jgi:hypothetical protein